MYRARNFLLAMPIALAAIFLFTGCGSDSSEPPKSEPKQIQSAEKKSTPQPLGKNWIKDSNNVYLWNPQPQDGETVTWSGNFIQDENYKFADGSGTVTWYLNGEVEQVDEGSLKHGQRHGRFTHEFPSGRVIHGEWDNGVEISSYETNKNDLSVENQNPVKIEPEQKAAEKINTPKTHSLQESADNIVNHAKAKFGVSTYANCAPENLFRYSAYLLMVKLGYDKDKKNNPQFSLYDNREQEQKFLALITYLAKEGDLALTYGVYKHPDYIKKVLKGDNSLVAAGISLAEINESEKKRDSSYDNLKSLSSASFATDDEYRQSMNEMIQKFDEMFADNFGADGRKVDDIMRDLISKYYR